MIRKRSLAYLLLALFIPGDLVCRAQSATDGAISGAVVDASGSQIPGAHVTIKSDDTGLTQSLVADGQGLFRVPQLQTGAYTVVVAATGFSTNRIEHVVVSVGALTSVSPRLLVSSTAENITVSGDTSQINTASPEISTSFNQVAIDNLPINGRRWSNFALLTPSVTADPQAPDF